MVRVVAIVFIVGLMAAGARLVFPPFLFFNTASAQEAAIVATSSLLQAPQSAWESASTTRAVATSSSVELEPQRAYAAEEPIRVIIPSINLNAPIEAVGLDTSGSMAVPSGNSSNIGWYKNGPMPGQIGSSVLDAHVFAGFSELDRVRSGSEIIIETKSGQRLRFLVQRIRTYKLSELTSRMLFGNTGERMLNLITCAGSLTADHSTYTHRLVVYAVYTGVV